MLTKRDKWVMVALYAVLAVGLIVYLFVESPVVIVLAALPGALYCAYHLVSFVNRQMSDLRDVLGR